MNSLSFPMPNPESVALPSTQGQFAPYFANYVKDQLVQRYGPKTAFGGGLKVTTTLDLNLQKIAQQAIAKVLPQNGTNPAVALVAIDTQNDPGAIRAMVGGANYHKNQFNLATQGERQPGSSFKPFVLATALKENVSPSSILTSSKQVTINADGRLWHGQQLRGRGARADQPVAGDRVLGQLGVLAAHRDRRATKRRGDRARARDHVEARRRTSRSGSAPSPRRPLEMARAYGSFADGGKRIDGSIFGNEPRAIETVDVGDTAARERSRRTRRPHRRTRRRRSTSFSRASCSTAPAGRRRCRAGRSPARPARPRTTATPGSSATPPHLVVAVWVGYPDKLIPMTYQFHGHPVAGGTFPALIWKAFMQQAIPYLKLEPETFPPPPSLYASAGHRRQPRRRPAARRRRLQEHVPARVLRRGAAADERQGCAGGDVQAERGRDPGRRRGVARDAPSRGSIGQPLTPTVVYKPAKTGERLGSSSASSPSRHAVGLSRR